MARLGLDSARSDLPGLPQSIVVSVRWLQRGINAWRLATSSTIATLSEDGAWGPRTEAALAAVVSAIDPGSASSSRPTEDRRAVIISRKLEGYLASLERVSGPVTRTPIVDFTPQAQQDLVASGPGTGAELVPSSGTPPWVYAIAGVTFFAAAGVTYVALNTK